MPLAHTLTSSASLSVSIGFVNTNFGLEHLNNDMEIVPTIKKLRNNYDLKTWFGFKGYVEKNIEDVCKALDTRWLVSICDTYADFAEPHEAACALIVVTTVNMEKLAFSIRGSNNFDRPPRQPLWDGVESYLLAKGDMIPNFCFRLRRTLKEFPHLLRIYETVWRRMVAAENTSLGVMQKANRFDFNQLLTSDKVPRAMTRLQKSKMKLLANVNRIKLS